MLHFNATDAAFRNFVTNTVLYGDRIEYRNGDRVRLICPMPVRFTSTPLVAVRKTAWKNALREMEWFLSRSNRLDDLHPSVRKWWTPWVDQDGNVRYNYGQQFRMWRGPDLAGGYPEEVGAFDQVEALIDGIKKHPRSSRHIMTTWNPPEMYAADCPITNCHGTIIQCWVKDGRLVLYTYQRSVDLVCGLPHNWIQYWALLLWLARQTDLEPGVLAWQGGDVHVYADHLGMADRITTVRPGPARVPELVYKPTSVDFKADDFQLDGPYAPLITDKVKMIV